MRLSRKNTELLYVLATLAMFGVLLVGANRFSMSVSAQGPEVDYSKFLHTSQRHSSLGCNACHQRSDNSATPRFPGHSACTSCHLGQFTTPAVPMCLICHTDTNSNRPPLKTFPSSFKERFNVKFDHAQHLKGSARPQNGCSGCHSSSINRGFGLSIPANLAAQGCYACHTPTASHRLDVRLRHAAYVMIRRPITPRAPTQGLSSFVQSRGPRYSPASGLH